MLRSQVGSFFRKESLTRGSFCRLFSSAAAASCVNSQELPINPAIEKFEPYARKRFLLTQLVAIVLRTLDSRFLSGISFEESVNCYGMPRSLKLFAVVIELFSSRKMNGQIQCLIGSIVDYCENAGPNLFNLIYALLTYLEAKKVGVERKVSNFLLKALVDKEQFRYARGLFYDMMMWGPAPNVYTYSIMMDLYTSGDRLYLKEANEMLSEMRTKGIQPNAVTYSSYIHGLCRSGEVGSAWEFLTVLCVKGMPCNTYCFNGVIHGFCKTGQLTEALSVFDEMKRQKGLCGVGEMDGVWGLFGDLIKRGHLPDVVLYSRIIDRSVKDLDMDEAFSLYDMMLEERIQPNKFTYSSLINGVCRKGAVPIALELFDEMRSEGVVPDRKVYTSLIAVFCRAKNLKGALQLVREMERRGVLPDAFVYTSLINGFSKMLMMDVALKLMAEMQKLGFQPSVVTYTAVILGYHKSCRSERASEMYRAMLNAGILPDFKASMLFDTSGKEKKR
ncbi:hypothetical protein LUZ63_011337 [Rhynchospora breviuscula]|uniref:Pentatricopeptide repeat-containing protein n=1 Tax=Rhynchospora breviuscula TaxID=2022672 RepID=A0A9Q0CJM5_9POAL|nr:hypothetical protein LUZ63_011337 [Rhynchospora breviuscula]